MCVSNDGAKLASASQDGIMSLMTLPLCEDSLAHLIHTLVGHTRLVSCIQFRSCDSKLVSASADTTVKLWISCSMPCDSRTMRYSYFLQHGTNGYICGTSTNSTPCSSRLKDGMRATFDNQTVIDIGRVDTINSPPTYCKWKRNIKC
jgi:WD40 repeat protein